MTNSVAGEKKRRGEEEVLEHRGLFLVGSVGGASHRPKCECRSWNTGALCQHKAQVEEVQPSQPGARSCLQLVSGVTPLEGVARQLLLRLLHTGHH